MTPPDINLMDYAKQWGIPGIVLVALWYGVPKLWEWMQMRASITGQQNDLAHAGLQGVNEVVTTLRNQLSDMNGQLDLFRARLQQMEATLEKAITDKLNAEQSEAIARNDLFNLRLYVTRILAQLKSLGIEPVSQPPEPTVGGPK